MPIYEYRCTSCSHELETLQKFSDPLLTSCPACGTDSLTKKISAAGFQLKGSGWYATDFKGSGKPASKAKESSDKPAETKESSDKPAEASSTKADAAPAACGSGACAACS